MGQAIVLWLNWYSSSSSSICKFYSHTILPTSVGHSHLPTEEIQAFIPSSLILDCLDLVILYWHKCPFTFTTETRKTTITSVQLLISREALLWLYCLWAILSSLYIYIYTYIYIKMICVYIYMHRHSLIYVSHVEKKTAIIKKPLSVMRSEVQGRSKSLTWRSGLSQLGWWLKLEKYRKRNSSIMQKFWNKWSK